MGCSDLDLRDYFFGELPEAERSSAERHLRECPACAGELDQLRLMRGTLMTLPDEDVPRRIGFVSDKVFEPSALRRWWNSFWISGARLGFASAAMLSAALVVFALKEPRVVEKQVPVAVAAPVDAPKVDIKAVVDEAVAKAVDAQERRTSSLLAASEQRHRMEQRAMSLQVSDYLENLEKRVIRDRAVAMNYGGATQ